jgi:hypothetical protein
MLCCFVSIYFPHALPPKTMRPPIQSALSGSNSTRKYDRIAAAVRALYIYNRLSAALLLCTVYIRKEAREGGQQHCWAARIRATKT